MTLRRILAVVVFSIALVCSASVFATDQLYLCGIVTELDPQNATVTVDVKSESCPGVRVFKHAASNRISSLKVDERRCFFINSDQCRAGYRYRITKTDRD